MRARTGVATLALLVGASLFASRAAAEEPSPLPPPAPPPPTTAPAAAPPAAAPAAPPAAATLTSISAELGEAPPEPARSDPNPQKLALWLGGRAGVITFGNAFYTNQRGLDETTGNFARAGMSVEVDAGVRLFKRFTPYVFWEHGFHRQGRRFEGSDAHAYSNFYGLGFRYLAGAIDDLGFGFLTDLSVGIRTLTIASSSAGESYSMRALEIFRLGLGADIRVSRFFCVSPLAVISGGVMRSTEGNIRFSPAGSTDGLVEPTFKDGKNIDVETTYLVLGLGVGGHFDLFAR